MYEKQIAARNARARRRKNLAKQAAVLPSTATQSPARHDTQIISEQQKRDMRIRQAESALVQKENARRDAEDKHNAFLNTDVDEIDFMEIDQDWSERTERTEKVLRKNLQKAKQSEQQARRNLWSAKYDGLSNKKLKEALATITDEEEIGYVKAQQAKLVHSTYKKDLQTMSAVADPDSVFYDPAFAEKSAYRSTKLTDGSLGESDTGYADIDYEFINGNQDISELIVGMDRNYYQVSDQERQIYNYWHAYDIENGTDVAKRYLYLLQETLNDRDSALDYAKIEGKPLQEIAYGIKAEISKFANDVDALYRGEESYIPTSSTEMTSQRAYEGLADTLDFIRINGKSGGQLLYDQAGNLTNNAIEKVAGFVTDLAALADVYQEHINRGYTKEEASKETIATVPKLAVKRLASQITGHGLDFLGDKIFADEGLKPLQKILDKTDWFDLDSFTQEVASKIYGEVSKPKSDATTKPTEEETITLAKAEVVGKVYDKIFNQMGAAPEDISPNLRQSLQKALKDPAVSKRLEDKKVLSAEDREALLRKLSTVDPKKDGIGTYVGDLLFGEDGVVFSRSYLTNLAMLAYENRGYFNYDASAPRLFEQYRRNKF